MPKVVERVGAFWSELRRRNVFSVGAAYLVAAWGASLGAAELLPAFGVPDWAVRALVISAAIGFPITLALAWIFEITPKGVVKDTGARRRRGGADPDAALTQTVIAGRLKVDWQDSTGAHSKFFDRGFLIGRDPGCELWVDDPMVSRQHARVRLERGLWLLEDLGSRNGTRVDGGLVERASLPRRSEVRLYPAGPALRFELEHAGATTVRATLGGDESRVSDGAVTPAPASRE